MILWLKARRALVVLPACLVVFIVLVILVQDAIVPLPSIMGRSQVTLSLFLPVPLVAGIARCLELKLSAPEVTGVRPVPLADMAMVTAVASIGFVLCATAGSLLATPQAFATGRNVLFLVGLMLIGRSVAGEVAVMIPVGWLILTVFVGFRGPGDPYAWSIIAEPARVPHAAVAALLVFLAGLFLMPRTSRKLS